ncbi:protein kinase [Myxococcota bacterium]|nr:protein kinase [Myxococcota bacterium]
MNDDSLKEQSRRAVDALVKEVARQQREKNEPQLEPGHRVGQYYVLQKQIGKGGMGQVFQATHVLTGQTVAVKALSPDLEGDAGLRKRFVQEARAMAALDHPNLVTLHNLLHEGNRLFMVMQFIDGRDVDAMFRRCQGLSPQATVAIFAQALDGLAHAHSKGILHRDLKPANVLVTRDGQVKLIDFGLALISGGARLTLKGTHVGTTYYVAPEILLGGEATAQTDIYSLGVSIFEVLTNRLPFQGDTFAVHKAHIEQPPPDPRQFNPQISAPLAAIILKSLAKDPRQRFQTAEDFRRVLGNPPPIKPLVDCPLCGSPHPETEGETCVICGKTEVCQYHYTRDNGILCRPCKRHIQPPPLPTP